MEKVENLVGNWAFFHKISGKPGGKSEKFSPEWKNITLFCCEMGRSAAAFCCNGLSFSPPVCTPRRSACFFLNALSNHGTITSDKRETSTSGGMMHEQLAEQVGAQIWALRHSKPDQHSGGGADPFLCHLAVY